METEPGDAPKITRDAPKNTFNQPCVILSLYTPNTYIWYSKKRRKQLLPVRVQYLAHHLFGAGRLVRSIYACAHGGMLLNESFLSDALAGREGQTPPFKGRVHAAPTLCKTLYC